MVTSEYHSNRRYIKIDTLVEQKVSFRCYYCGNYIYQTKTIDNVKYVLSGQLFDNITLKKRYLFHIKCKKKWIEEGMKQR